MQSISLSEFISEVVEKLPTYFPKSLEGAEIHVQDVAQNDVTLKGLNIIQREFSMSPCIYLESFYNEYQEGRTIDSIINEIIAIRLLYEIECSFKTADILSYDYVKPRLKMRLTGIENNKDYLENNLYDTYLSPDLAECYVVEITENNNTYSVPVNKYLLKTWGIDDYELGVQSYDNTINEGFDIFSFKDLISSRFINYQNEDVKETLAALERTNMLVLTNERHNHGAITVINNDAMLDLKIRLGEFILLPCSTHEWIVVPKDSEMDLDTIKAMVIDIINREVAPRDRLSTNIYQYDFDDQKLINL